MQSELGTQEPRLKVSQVEFAIYLPDGSTRSTTLSDDEVRELVGSENEYSVSWWLRGAEQTLAIRAILASLADPPKDGKVPSGLQFGYSYSYACNPDDTVPDYPRIEVTYGRPRAT